MITITPIKIRVYFISMFLLSIPVLTACAIKPLSPTTEIESIPTEKPHGDVSISNQHQVAVEKNNPLTKKFTISGTNLPIKDILLLMAKDSGIGLEIHPTVQARISLNVERQTMQQILESISRQSNLVYRVDEVTNTLIIEPDFPVLKHYKIDYVNIERDTKGGISVTNQLASTQVALRNNSAGASSNAQLNNSSTTVSSVSTHHFWKTLIKNIEDILEETDKQILIKRLEFDARLQADFDKEIQQYRGRVTDEIKNLDNTKGNNEIGLRSDSKNEFSDNEKKLKSYRTLFASKIIANKEAGVISIRTTQQQHRKIQEFIELIKASSNKQVLIEAAIVEITLNDEYQSGVDWSRLANAGAEKGWTFSQKLIANNLSAAPVNSIAFKQSTRLGELAANIKFLQIFGKTKVLSSPKLMVMNNQTAILKVVDNLVYFTVNADTTIGNTNSPAISNTTTTPYSIPVGIWMSVTPQISEQQEITLNIRPTIARQIGQGIQDPNPNIKIESRIPQIQVREMESILQVGDGSTVMLGGLMQEELISKQIGVPGLMTIPLIGKLFQYQQQQLSKTELVILLKPVISQTAVNISQISDQALTHQGAIQ